MQTANYQAATLHDDFVPKLIKSPTPLLNADGERMRTIVENACGRFIHMLEDLPFAPAGLDLDEDPVLLNAMRDLEASWEQLLARMPENGRQNLGYAQNQVITPASIRASYARAMGSKRSRAARVRRCLLCCLAMRQSIAPADILQVSRIHGIPRMPWFLTRSLVYPSEIGLRTRVETIRYKRYEGTAVTRPPSAGRRILNGVMSF